MFSHLLSCLHKKVYYYEKEFEITFFLAVLIIAAAERIAPGAKFVKRKIHFTNFLLSTSIYHAPDVYLIPLNVRIVYSCARVGVRTDINLPCHLESFRFFNLFVGPSIRCSTRSCIYPFYPFINFSVRLQNSMCAVIRVVYAFR